MWYAIGESISTSGSNTAVSAVLNSLTLMLYLLVPWTALNLVDFFFVRRGHYAIPNHVANRVDYSWLVGLLVSGLLYLVLSRSLNLTAEQDAISASERQLQAIDAAAEGLGQSSTAAEGLGQAEGGLT